MDETRAQLYQEWSNQLGRRSVETRIRIKKTTTSELLGAVITISERGISIQDVKDEGALARHNADAKRSASDTSPICVGDVVVAVNGQRTSVDMLRCIENDLELDLTLTRSMRDPPPTAARSEPPDSPPRIEIGIEDIVAPPAHRQIHERENWRERSGGLLGEICDEYGFEATPPICGQRVYNPRASMLRIADVIVFDPPHEEDACMGNSCEREVCFCGIRF
mmetsp:Transcript_47171/g.131688  ORF Transcript_47171/g.131688 Transcript_47171/m.131688 type:complete len:222 (+) Transcript_47171:79-744(+)